MSKLSFLVPRISKTQFDSEATAFLEKYCPEALWTPMCVPIETIATEKMQLTVLEYRMSEDLSILGQICFTDGKTEIYDADEDEYREIVVSAGTMIIDPDTYAKRNIGSKRNTMAHECYHWHRHRQYHQWAAKLSGEGTTAHRCPIVPKDERLSKEWDDIDWMEWQANNVAPKILMPAETVRQTYEWMCEESLKNPFVAKKLRPQAEWVIEQTAGFYQVSKQAAEIRLKELNLLG